MKTAHSFPAPKPTRRPILIVAGFPSSEGEQGAFSVRLREAVGALARAAFTRNHPVAVLNDDRLLPMLLSISTEYQAFDEGVPSASSPWVHLFGNRPEEWSDDFEDWVKAGLARQDFEGDDTQAMDAYLRTAKLPAVFALGGGGQVEIFVARLLADAPPSLRRPSLFFIRSVGGAVEKIHDYTGGESHDADTLKGMAAGLRVVGLELDTTEDFDDVALLYPLIMQRLVDRLDG